jgi:uncharacterized protein
MPCWCMADRERTGVLEQTERTSLRRKRERGSYERDLAYAVLDEALVCHVGVELQGSPHVIPMVHVRVGEDLYLHGAPANRVLRLVAEGAPLSIAATVVDGLVLARAAMHHSVNYRCVVLYGCGTRVSDDAEIDAASAALLDHMAPGRAGDARPPNDAERRRTLFVRVPIAEGSVKVRSGPPIDDAEDLGLDIWAGVLPLYVTGGQPEPDPDLAPVTPVPAYATAYPRRSAT